MICWSPVLISSRRHIRTLEVTRFTIIYLLIYTLEMGQHQLLVVIYTSLFFFFFFCICLFYSHAILNNTSKIIMGQLSCLFVCSRRNAVWPSIFQMVPRRAAATAGWETQSPAVQPVPPSLFPLTFPKRSTMNKHHQTAAPREMETQTLNPVSTIFSAFRLETWFISGHLCF